MCVLKDKCSQLLIWHAGFKQKNIMVPSAEICCVQYTQDDLNSTFKMWNQFEDLIVVLFCSLLSNWGFTELHEVSTMTEISTEVHVQQCWFVDVSLVAKLIPP